MILGNPVRQFKQPLKKAEVFFFKELAHLRIGKNFGNIIAYSTPQNLSGLPDACGEPFTGKNTLEMLIELCGILGKRGHMLRIFSNSIV